VLKEEDAGDQLTSDSGDQDKIITTVVAFVPEPGRK